MATRKNKRKSASKSKLSPWIIFVKKVHKENPGKTYGQAMKIAASLKKSAKKK